jgi:hypothetical protein
MTEERPSTAGSSSPSASSRTPTGLSSTALKDVLTEDFRQQCTNLQNQYTRMHGRMQLITGLNTALLPALGALAVAAGRDDVGYGWLLLFPAAGMLLSMIGYVAGANDRHLVDLYRTQLAQTAYNLLVSNGVADPETVYKTWVHAGRDPREVSDIVGKPRNSLTSWRWSPVSVTRLPALLSLVFFFVWLLVVLILLVIALLQNTLLRPCP